jgi:hypothetical protein
MKMILIATAVQIALVCCAAGSSFGDETPFIAIVKSVSGEVTVTRQDEPIMAEAGMQLRQNDVIVSGSESTAGITFVDGTLLSIGPSSHVDLQQYLFEPIEQNYDFSLYLKKGRAVYSSGKIGKLAPEKIKVNTPRATLGIRGTRFIVRVD